MHNILNKLQQLNESTDVTEAEKKCDDCGKPISKCECEGHDHKEEMDESKSSAIAEAVSQVEAKLLREYAEFKEAKGKDHDGDGDVDSDDYLAAKDKAIKKAMGKDEEEKEDVSEMFSKHDKVGTKKKTTHGTAEKTATGLKHTRDYKPDYLDLDKDGDTEEPMKKAAKDKKEKKA